MKRTIFAAMAAAALLAGGQAGAGALYWDGNGATAPNPSGSGTWDASTTPNWNTASDYSGTYGVWTQAGGQDVARFPAIAGTSTVTVSGTVQVNEMRFTQASGVTYTFTGGTIQLTGSGLIGASANTLGVTLNINTTLSGSVGVNFDTRQVVNLNAPANYTGNTTINTGGGAVTLNVNNALPVGTIVQAGPMGQSKLTIPNGITATVAGLEGSFSLCGTAGATATGMLILDRAAGTSTFTGDSAGTEMNLTKRGAYTQVWGGTAASTRLVSFTMDGGLFVLDKPDGVEALASMRSPTTNPTQVFLASGELRLDSNEQIQNNAPITFQGGTFNLNGYSETVGALAVAGGGTIDFGAAGSVLHFASGAHTGGVLSILNWEGDLAGGGADQLRFTTDPGDAFLAAVQFDGYGLGEALSLDMGGWFEIVPKQVQPQEIPEPASAILLTSGAAALGVLRRRR